MAGNTQKNFKILLLNLGYCTGINGSLLQYLANFYRYFYLPRKIERNVLGKLKTIIAKVNPDLVCLIEIKQGKQIKTLIDNEYPFSSIETKYGKKSPLRKFPFFKNNSNAFIAKNKLLFKQYYLKNGVKKLVYEITLPNNTSLVMAHFSLNRRTRNKQFKEINGMFSKTKRKIICGDFNTSKGLDKLSYLIKNSDLRIAHENPTFPACNPKKFLDLFLCSKNMKNKAKTLDAQVSDHLPVMLEISP